MKNQTKINADEFIKERERYAEIGDDLDIAFVELIPGVEICYNDRHPKPPTPPPKDPTPPPPKEPTPPQAEGAAEAVVTIVNADGTVIEVPATIGEDGQPIPIAAAAIVEPEVPKGPPPPPPPFEYNKDLPPEGAEVPFVRNYEPPPPEPEPVPVPEGEEAAAAAVTEGGENAAVPADGAVPAAEGETQPAAPTDAPADAPAADTAAPAADAAATDIPATAEAPAAPSDAPTIADAPAAPAEAAAETPAAS